MGIDKKEMNKGIGKLAWAWPLLFSGPTTIYNAFINKGNTWHYLVLAIGIAICLGGVYMMFVGIKTIVDCLFDSNDD
jgi:hypothetical protein